MTQYQFTKIYGYNYSEFSNTQDAPLHPVEKVSYYTIRGATEGRKWSADAESITAIREAVDAGSFIYKFRQKNAVALANLDLPSDVQWEVAARAGVLATMYDGYLNTNTAEGTAGRHLAVLGWYYGNGGVTDGGATSNGTVRVGSYIPNQYGLYDVLGNVAEWTGDVFMETPASQTYFPSGTEWLDPVGGLNNNDTYDGANANKSRSAYRGGWWYQSARGSTLSNRPKTDRSSSNNSVGFRLCITED